MEELADNKLKKNLGRNKKIVMIGLGLGIVGLGSYYGLVKKEPEPAKMMLTASCPNTTCTSHYKRIYVAPNNFYCQAC